ncbi:MAG: hypothetical protein K0S53_2020 [Bacteroidetes bacterium]|nr:hypothetical protein [Bacteroidota bacterium]
MRHKFYIILCLCFSLQLQTVAQSVKDSCFRILMVGMHASGQLPKYDLEKRFGPNLSAGLNFTWKTKHNLLFSVEGSYFFGRNVKEDVVANMRNSDGHITDNEGYPADLRLTERGWNIYGNVGYMISKLGNNPNSGVFITVGAGWTQHKIKLYDANQKIAAVNGDLKKGYDRLSGGFGISQFIGYKYISNNRLANCYFGFEFYEAHTKSFRGFNYDTGLTDTQQRFDVLMGFRFGWILPLYKRTKDFYYY